MSVWKKVAIVITGLGFTFIIITVLTLGIIWGMALEMGVIISVIVAQIIVYITGCLFAERNLYSQLKYWLLGYMTLVSIGIIFMYLFAVVVENIWWWVPTSYSLILTEILITSLFFYIKSES